MTDHRDFLAAIIDRPDDDLPRLVYADFLEESGDDARAEFIRVQCELARLGEHDATRAALVEREVALHRDHRPQWVIPQLKGIQIFRRGFVETIGTTAERFIGSADEIFATTPLQQVRLYNADQHVALLLRLAGLSRLTYLDVSNCSSATVNRLLAEAPLDRLRRLVARNCRIWPEGIAEIARMPVVAHLTSLDLAGNPISDSGVTIIADEPNFGGLTALILRSNELAEENCIRWEGVRALADSTTLTRLESLDLAAHYVGDLGVTELAGSENFARLRELDLAYNEIGTEGAEAYRQLVQSPHLQQLRTLSLAGNLLGTEATALLLEWVRRLPDRTLDLRDTDPDPASRELIKMSPWAIQILTDTDEN